MILRGIIDRLDRLSDGTLAVVDYKTGRAPRAEQSRSRLSAVQLYALLCEHVLGTRPTVVRLIYLRDRIVVSADATDQSLRGVHQRARAIWAAIERACERNDFRPIHRRCASGARSRRTAPRTAATPSRPPRWRSSPVGEPRVAAPGACPTVLPLRCPPDLRTVHARCELPAVKDRGSSTTRSTAGSPTFAATVSPTACSIRPRRSVSSASSGSSLRSYGRCGAGRTTNGRPYGRLSATVQSP